MNFIISFLILISFFIGNPASREIDVIYSKNFNAAKVAGEIADFELSEASGMVASRQHKDMFWVINDSGNLPKLYLIDKNGKTVTSFLIDGYGNYDWEDIAIYTDKKSGKSELFIADIGDNMAIRDHINIIQLSEPSNIDGEDSVIYHAKNHCFRYEDGARDAETLMIDPLSKDMYIISKRERNVRIYQVPDIEETTDTLTLSFKHTLPFFNVNAGDISEDGTEILLKNYNAIFYWKRDKDESLVDAMIKDHELLQYKPEPQGESIAWSPDKKGYYTLSERNPPLAQYLYFYARANNE